MPQFEKRRFRPAQLISRLQVEHAWLFRAIDHQRSRQALVDRERARSQYLTTLEAQTILRDAGEVIYDVEAGRLGPVQIAGLAAWRMTKGIFRFDQEMSKQLLQTRTDPSMQGYVLAKLPQWCVYVEAVGSMTRYGVHGFWAFAEGYGQDTAALHLLFDEDSRIRHVQVSLNGRMAPAVTAAIRHQGDGQRDDDDGDVLILPRVVGGVASVVEAAVTLLTYLCCSNATVGERGRSPHNPMPVRAGMGWALFPADRPTLWMVGHGRAVHAHEVAEAIAGGAERPRFQVRDVVRKGGVLDQEVLWVDVAVQR